MQVPKSKLMVKKQVSRRVTGRRVKQPGVPPRKSQPGPKRVLTQAWCELVKARLEELGWTDVQLAAKLGIAKGMLSKILNMKQSTSTHVDRIGELLDIPGPEFTDALEARVVMTLRDLRKEWPEEFDAIMAKIWSAQTRMRDRERKDR